MGQLLEPSYPETLTGSQHLGVPGPIIGHRIELWCYPFPAEGTMSHILAL